jgi:hypothetical protein
MTFASLPKNLSSLVTFGFNEIGPYYWVGNCKNGIDYYLGQTFRAPAQGWLKRIKIFTSIVFGSCNATLIVYEFDAATLSWKQKLGEAIKHITKAEEGKWVQFELTNLEVDKNGMYAFKVSCSGDGMLAIAECPWSIINPYAEGVEWVGSSKLQEGNFHKDFDVAFQGEIEPSVNGQLI